MISPTEQRPQTPSATCETVAASEGPSQRRRFSFERDTFAFANELVWEYRFDPVTGATTTFTNNPPPAYVHRCLVMVRSARQFLYHARFEPAAPQADDSTNRSLIREVVSRNPRQTSAEAERVMVPGYDCLRSFSKAQEPLLKAECGEAWESYFLQNHWRMVFPIWGRQQERLAARLAAALQDGAVPIAHLFRFPRISINHDVLLFDVAETEQEVQFDAYDPNIPAHPIKLTFDRRGRRFRFPRLHYWAGGEVGVTEALSGGVKGVGSVG